MRSGALALCLLATTLTASLVSATETEVPKTASLVMLHGLGASGSDFDDFKRMLPPWVDLVTPNAPEREIAVNRGQKSRAWYNVWPGTGSDKFDLRDDDEGIHDSMKMIHEVVSNEAKKYGGYHRVVVGGFSQGAAMAIMIGLTTPWPLGFVMAHSGYLMKRENFPQKIPGRNPASSRVKFLVFNHQNDPLIPFDWAFEGYSIMAKAGYFVETHNSPGQNHSFFKDGSDLELFGKHIQAAFPRRDPKIDKPKGPKTYKNSPRKEEL